MSAGKQEKRQMEPQSQVLVNRVKGEFNEMPGLQLTMAQAAKLWGLDDASCQEVIDVLIDAEFLTRTPAGTIVRMSGRR